jgi:transcriptional regulator with XRE-family HTH domain
MMTEMGLDLSLARRSRRISQEHLADEMCVSRKLVSRMESGDPTVSFGAYAMAAWVMKLDGSLTEIFSPRKDKVFQERARSVLEKRVREKKPGRDDPDA